MTLNKIDAYVTSAVYQFLNNILEADGNRCIYGILQ